MQFPTLGNCSLRAKQPVFRSPDGETSSLRAFRCSPAASLVQGNRPTAAAALQHKVLATSNSRDSSSTEWHKSSLITFRHSLSASLVRGRRPAAAAALQEQKVHAGYKSHDSSTESVTSRTLHRAALGVAASGLTATLLMCPGPVLAADVPQPTQDAQVRAGALICHKQCSLPGPWLHCTSLIYEERWDQASQIFFTPIVCFWLHSGDHILAFLPAEPAHQRLVAPSCTISISLSVCLAVTCRGVRCCCQLEASRETCRQLRHLPLWLTVAVSCWRV